MKPETATTVVARLDRATTAQPSAAMRFPCDPTMSQTCTTPEDQRQAISLAHFGMREMVAPCVELPNRATKNSLHVKQTRTREVRFQHTGPIFSARDAQPERAAGLGARRVLGGPRGGVTAGS